MASLTIHNQTDRDAIEVELMFKLADQMKAASVTLGKIKLGREALDALLDRQVYPGDLGDLGREIEVIASIWQGEIDGGAEAPPQDAEQSAAMRGTA